MMFGRYTALPMLAAVVLLGASLSFAASVNKSSHEKEARSAASSHKKQSAAAHTRGHKTTTSPRVHKRSHHSSRRSRRHRSRGQRVIADERAEEIQAALIREHYLKGKPSGTWDSATKEAMRRYQADQGWQTKVVPDSRALIHLGLGPSTNHLLNPESAMLAGQQALPSPTTASHPAAGTGSSPIQPSQSATPVNTAPDLSSAQ
jgi:peptidoglycan hydrolase-like protein with peptidoglycan-binding domain